MAHGDEVRSLLLRPHHAGNLGNRQHIALGYLAPLNLFKLDFLKASGSSRSNGSSSSGRIWKRINPWGWWQRRPLFSNCATLGCGISTILARRTAVTVPSMRLASPGSAGAPIRIAHLMIHFLRSRASLSGRDVSRGALPPAKCRRQYSPPLLKSTAG